MLTAEFKPWHIPLFIAKYAWLASVRRPVLVHFEVTMRCNARCGFCDYWKTDPSAKASELQSFADAARYFNPVLITFTGGEPTLRRDLEDLVAAVKAAVRLKYIMLITHGGMLTPERARPRSGRRHRARRGRAALFQAQDARRDHELGLLSVPDPALHPWRDEGAVPLGHAHDTH